MASESRGIQGGLALGTARMAAAATTLEEYPLDAVEGIATVEAIADRLGAYAAAVRADIESALELGDQDTADLFIEVSRTIDKHLWFAAPSRRGPSPGTARERT